jgi:uncharacterized SAM-binding protein YcdF (DUF218 family)
MKVLVTLGNRMNDDGTFSNAMMDSLNKTLEVEKDFDKVVVTGGIANPKAGVAEGDKMCEWLVSQGVNPDKILVENRSLTTKENAKYTASILAELGVKEITLLSSAYHIDRWYLNPIKLFKKHAKVKIAGTIKA